MDHIVIVLVLLIADKTSVKIRRGDNADSAECGSAKRVHNFRERERERIQRDFPAHLPCSTGFQQVQLPSLSSSRCSLVNSLELIRNFFFKFCSRKSLVFLNFKQEILFIFVCVSHLKWPL